MSWDEFDIACECLAKQIKKSKFKPEVIHTIPRGGFCVAARLAHLLNIKYIEIDKDKTENNYWNILLIDDISDTGNTILQNFPRYCNCKIATLYYKPTSKVKPDFYASETDKWVVFPWEEK